ncbi:hypothetical protein MBLNU459_g7942t1 [Dothideomycetes sp. NU459]
MSKLEIIIKNQSNEVQQFMIFSGTPGYSASTGKAWINFWGRSPGVGATSDYAVCGMEKRALAIELQVSICDRRSVDLAVNDTKGTEVAFGIQQGGAVLSKKTIGTVEQDGAFGIATGTYDVAVYKHAFCGLGMKNPMPGETSIVPVAVWQVMPNIKYQIAPKRTYYVAFGKYTPGQVVNLNELGATAPIDFTGRKETIATVVFTNELSFDAVEYTFAAPWRSKQKL